MFLCVSPNPAMDRRLLVDTLSPGNVLRASSVRADAGGKSAHVAMTLQVLHGNPLWLGFAGGDTGRALVSGLQHFGIRVHPVPTIRDTRMNLEIHESSGRITEILEPGPALEASELVHFRNACKDAYTQGRESLTVIFSGSLPSGAPPDFYSVLIADARSFGCRVFLDTSGEPLRHGLSARPDFVKPNREEAEKLLGMKIDSLESAADALQKICEMGVASVALSLGAEGLLFCPGKGEAARFAPAIPLKPKSTVGCGDATVAGFAWAKQRKLSPEDAVRLATACAAANCLAPTPGALLTEDIERFRNQVQVRNLTGK